MSLGDLPLTLPVFPLPETVFFSNTLLPLRIFEPRYLEMIRDVRAKDNWLAVTLLRSGLPEDYDGAPPWHSVAGVGMVTEYTENPDGTLLILVEGHHRVEVKEVESNTSYRRGEIRIIPERHEWLETEEAGKVVSEVAALGKSLGFFTKSAFDIPANWRGRAAFLHLVLQRVSGNPRERQALLELPGFEERAEIILSRCQMAWLASELVERKPKDPERN